jgi:DNA-binding XRE family transcriptional regulator
MTTPRDLDRLAQRVKAHRLELYPSRLAAAQAAGISKDTWKRVEAGLPVLDVKYAQIGRALGWTGGSCIAIAEGGEPVLADRAADGPAATPVAPLNAEVVRKAAFEAARAKMPTAPIGDIDAFSEELVDILRRAGEVENSG